MLKMVVQTNVRIKTLNPLGFFSILNVPTKFPSSFLKVSHDVPNSTTFFFPFVLPKAIFFSPYMWANLNTKSNSDVETCWVGQTTKQTFDHHPKNFVMSP
jgi:hypothetical protein